MKQRFVSYFLFCQNDFWGEHLTRPGFYSPASAQVCPRFARIPRAEKALPLVWVFGFQIRGLGFGF